MSRPSLSTAIAIAMLVAAVPAGAQTAVAGATPISVAAQPAPAGAPPAIATGLTPPVDYVIGVDDQLEVLYWQDKDMSAGVTVRPDGNISLPLLNDVKAAGLTPEELRVAITSGAAKFVDGPTVSVVVKAINSRKVFLTGQVGKPGPYPLMDGTTTVLQMLATAGGPSEYAKTEKIAIVRRENGKDLIFKFNYKNVSLGKALEQNIVLKPGDTIIVP